MKILVINGSPSTEGDGNTMVLTNAFLRGAGWANPEIIDVKNINIKGCRGCFGCWSYTPGDCVMDDDMANILPKLIAADVVIWSFPLYFFGVPGELKKFIDRQSPLYKPNTQGNSYGSYRTYRYDLGHQRHILISTCSFWTHSGCYTAVTSMFRCIIGAPCPTIFCGQGGLLYLSSMADAAGMWEIKKPVDDYVEAVRLAGKEFAGGEISAATKNRLEEPILPKEAYERELMASWKTP